MIRFVTAFNLFVLIINLETILIIFSKFTHSLKTGKSIPTIVEK